MTFIAWGQNTPQGIRWKENFPCSLSTVWPALFPPENRATTSASRERKSMILPFPSSPPVATENGVSRH